MNEADWGEVADLLEDLRKYGDVRDDDEDWRTAVHEAGHAVAASLCGVQWTVATIEPEGPFGGYVTVEETDSPLDSAFFLMAGMIAEEMFDVWSDYASDFDLEQLDRLQLTSDQLATVEDELRHAFASARTAIEQLAERLIDERMIVPPAH